MLIQKISGSKMDHFQLQMQILGAEKIYVYTFYLCEKEDTNVACIYYAYILPIICFSIYHNCQHLKNDITNRDETASNKLK